ncbi:hypothetical protein TNCV_1618351 [Trichonephila clavipes]|nr:hypothetical protein TNCV_1618351 [Trichonephila clavipes]
MQHPFESWPLGHRLEWCKELKNWTSHQLICVLFGDDSRFCATSDSQHQLIWREVGTWFHPSQGRSYHRINDTGPPSYRGHE